MKTTSVLDLRMGRWDDDAWKGVAIIVLNVVLTVSSTVTVMLSGYYYRIISITTMMTRGKVGHKTHRIRRVQLRLPDAMLLLHHLGTESLSPVGTMTRSSDHLRTHGPSTCALAGGRR